MTWTDNLGGLCPGGDRGHASSSSDSDDSDRTRRATCTPSPVPLLQCAATRGLNKPGLGSPCRQWARQTADGVAFSKQGLDYAPKMGGGRGSINVFLRFSGVASVQTHARARTRRHRRASGMRVRGRWRSLSSQSSEGTDGYLPAVGKRLGARHDSHRSFRTCERRFADVEPRVSRPCDVWAGLGTITGVVDIEGGREGAGIVRRETTPVHSQ